MLIHLFSIDCAPETESFAPRAVNFDMTMTNDRENAELAKKFQCLSFLKCQSISAIAVLTAKQVLLVLILHTFNEAI